MSLREEHEIESRYDLTGIVVKPLYFGLFTNILIPMMLLMLCYYVNNNNPLDNRVGGLANPLFYIFITLAVIQGVFALWYRNKLLKKPLVQRKERIEIDITVNLLKASRPVFIIISAISLWGFIYFFLTGRFVETVVLVFMSFIVFQIIRPRVGQVKKLIIYQENLVEKGDYLSGQ